MGLDSSILPPNLSPIQPGEVRRRCFNDFSWVGKRVPTGSVFATYAYAVNGSLVSLWFRISAQLPGRRISGVYFKLPEELPRPDSFSAQMPTEMFIGHGILSKSALITSESWRRPAVPALVTIRKDGFGSFGVHLVAKPIAATHAWGIVHYYS